MNLFYLFSLAIILKLGCSIDGMPKILVVSGDFFFLLYIILGLIKKKTNINKSLNLFIASSVLFIWSTLWDNRSLADAVNSQLRLFLPFFVFFTLSEHLKNTSFKKALNRLFPIIIVLIISFFIYGIYNLPPILKNGEIILPCYFQGPHSTAYTLLCAFYMSFFFTQININNSILKISISVVLLVVTFQVIYIGLGVKSAILSLLFFVSSLLSLKIKMHGYTKVIMGILLFSFLLVTISDKVTINDLKVFSNGRIERYSEKMDELDKYDFIQWLVGKGANSDFTESKVWFTASGGISAHNDLISFLIERGLLGIFLFFLFFSNIIKSSTNKLSNILIISFFVTSTISNGIIVRPIASYLLFTCLAYVNSFFPSTAQVTFNDHINLEKVNKNAI